MSTLDLSTTPMAHLHGSPPQLSAHATAGVDEVFHQSTQPVYNLIWS